MRKNFPDEVRVKVSHEKPKKREIAAHNIAAKNIIIVLQQQKKTNSSFKTCSSCNFDKFDTVLKLFRKF